MKLLDKFKNIFTEEVEEEIETEIKTEIKEPKREMPKINVEKPITISKIDSIREEKPKEIKKEEKFVFPVYFDDKDFEKEQPKHKETVSKETKTESKQPIRENYKDAYNKANNEKKRFKPTPIISPVYGILEKNYYKEDIVVTPRRRIFHESEKDLTIDDVRKRAYGTLEDDLEKTLFSGNDIKTKINDHNNDDQIFNELDFANAIEEDKKRDLSKKDLKSDIESLLNDKDFSNEFDYHIQQNEEVIPEEEQESSKESDDSLVSNNQELDSDFISDNQDLSNDIEETINEDNNEKEEDITDGELEINNGTMSENEIENAFADSSDLNDSDLFNLIDSMYEEENNE